MTKPETLGIGLLPALALAAGLLSGSVFRQAAPAERGDQPAAASAAAVTEPSGESGWISDLRPVMETLGLSMGLSIPRNASARTLRAAGTELDSSSDAGRVDSRLLAAIGDVRTDVEGRASVSGACTTATKAVDAARYLNAYLVGGRKPDDGSGRLRWPRGQAAVRSGRHGGGDVVDASRAARAPRPS